MTRILVKMTIILGGPKMSDFTEINGKRKEEILEKSRKTIKDEGFENAHLRGINLGVIITTLAIGAPLFVISIITNQMAALGAICTINGIFLSIRKFIIYRFTKKKSYLIWSIILGVTGLATFVMFVLKAFGL